MIRLSIRFHILYVEILLLMGNHNMKYLCNLFGYYIGNVNPYYICVIIEICIYFKEYRVLSYYLFLFIIALI